MDIKCLIIEEHEMFDGKAYIVWLSINDNNNEYAFFCNKEKSILTPSNENLEFFNNLENSVKEEIITIIKSNINDNK